jgi:hypothetical protein
MARDPSPAEWEAEVTRVQKLRAERLARHPAADASRQPAVPLTVEIHGDRTPRFTEHETAGLIEGYRAAYTRYAHAPEIVDLLEERLAAALKADGLALPPMTAEARLQILRRGHAAKAN